MNIGEMLVSLGLDDSNFKSGLDSARTSFNDLAKTVAKIGSDIGGVFQTGKNSVAAWGSSIDQATKSVEALKARQAEILNQMEAIKRTGSMASSGGIITAGGGLNEAQQKNILAGLQKEYDGLDVKIKEINNTVQQYNSTLAALQQRKSYLISQMELMASATNVDGAAMTKLGNEVKVVNQDIARITNTINQYTNTTKESARQTVTYANAIDALNAKKKGLQDQLYNLAAQHLPANAQAMEKLNNQIRACNTEITAITNESKSYQQRIDEQRKSTNFWSDAVQYNSQKQAELLKEINRLSKEGFEKNKTQINEYKQHLEHLREEMIKLNVQSKTTREIVTEFGTALTKFGQVMTTAVTLPLALLARQMLKYAGDMQLYQVSFETMFSSAAKAANLIDELRIMAAKTPFEMKDLTAGARTLVQFGESAETVMKTVQVLGDIAQGNNERFERLSLAYAQMSSAGRLLAQDLYQMVNAGFNPLLYISQKTGESLIQLRERMADGKITTEEVKEAFYQATQEGGRFYQGMEKASKTLPGLVSTLKDDVAVMGKTFTDVATEDIANFVKGLSNIAKWVTALPAPIKAGTVAIAGFAAAIGPLSIAIGSLITLAAKLKTALIALGVTAASASGIGAIAVAATAAIGALLGIGAALKTVRIDAYLEAASEKLRDSVSSGEKLTDAIKEVADETGLTVSKVADLARKEGLITEEVYDQVDALVSSNAERDKEADTLDDTVAKNEGLNRAIDTYLGNLRGSIVTFNAISTKVNELSTQFGVSDLRVIALLQSNKNVTEELKIQLGILKNQAVEIDTISKSELARAKGQLGMNKAETEAAEITRKANEALEIYNKADKSTLTRRIQANDIYIASLKRIGATDRGVFEDALKLQTLLNQEKEDTAKLDKDREKTEKDYGAELSRIQGLINQGQITETDAAEARLKAAETARDSFLDLKFTYGKLFTKEDAARLSFFYGEVKKGTKIVQEAVNEEEYQADRIKNTTNAIEILNKELDKNNSEATKVLETKYELSDVDELNRKSTELFSKALIELDNGNEKVGESLMFLSGAYKIAANNVNRLNEVAKKQEIKEQIKDIDAETEKLLSTTIDFADIEEYAAKAVLLRGKADKALYSGATNLANAYNRQAYVIDFLVKKASEYSDKEAATTKTIEAQRGEISNLEAEANKLLTTQGKLEDKQSLLSLKAEAFTKSLEAERLGNTKLAEAYMFLSGAYGIAANNIDRAAKAQEEARVAERTKEVTKETQTLLDTTLNLEEAEKLREQVVLTLGEADRELAKGNKGLTNALNANAFAMQFAIDKATELNRETVDGEYRTRLSEQAYKDLNKTLDDNAKRTAFLYENTLDINKLKKGDAELTKLETERTAAFNNAKIAESEGNFTLVASYNALGVAINSYINRSKDAFSEEALNDITEAQKSYNKEITKSGQIITTSAQGQLDSLSMQKSATESLIASLKEIRGEFALAWGPEQQALLDTAEINLSEIATRINTANTALIEENKQLNKSVELYKDIDKADQPDTKLLEQRGKLEQERYEAAVAYNKLLDRYIPKINAEELKGNNVLTAQAGTLENLLSLNKELYGANSDLALSFQRLDLTKLEGIPLQDIIDKTEEFTTRIDIANATAIQGFEGQTESLSLLTKEVALLAELREIDEAAYYDFVAKLDKEANEAEIERLKKLIEERKEIKQEESDALAEDYAKVAEFEEQLTQKIATENDKRRKDFYQMWKDQAADLRTFGVTFKEMQSDFTQGLLEIDFSILMDQLKELNPGMYELQVELNNIRKAAGQKVTSSDLDFLTERVELATNTLDYFRDRQTDYANTVYEIRKTLNEKLEKAYDEDSNNFYKALIQNVDNLVESEQDIYVVTKFVTKALEGFDISKQIEAVRGRLKELNPAILEVYDNFLMGRKAALSFSDVEIGQNLVDVEVERLANITEYEKKYADTIAALQESITNKIESENDLRTLSFYKYLDQNIKAMQATGADLADIMKFYTDEVNNFTADNAIAEYWENAKNAGKTSTEQQIAYFESLIKKGGLTEIQLEAIKNILNDLGNKKQKEQFLKYFDVIMDGIQKVVSAMKGLFDQIYQNQLDAIDKKKEADYTAADEAYKLALKTAEEEGRIKRDFNELTLDEQIDSLTKQLTTIRSKKKKAAIQEQIDRLKIDKDYEDAKKKADKEAALAKYEIQKKQFYTDRGFALGQIAIDTAVGIAKIWAQSALNPIWAGIATAALVGAAALQTAAVLTQKPPEAPALAEGGIVPARPSGQLVRVAEANMAEAIIPLDRLGEVINSIQPMRNVTPGYGAETGDIHLTVMMDSKPILQKIFPATKNRQILIHANAVVGGTL